MKARMFKVESKSHPGTYHTVRVMPDLTVRCSCPAFVFRNDCSHIKKFQERIEQKILGGLIQMNNTKEIKLNKMNKTEGKIA